MFNPSLMIVILQSLMNLVGKNFLTLSLHQKHLKRNINSNPKEVTRNSE